MGKHMNNKFDELAKGLAQSVTRRQAFKQFGVGLAGMALACLGIGNKAGAASKGHGYCQVYYDGFTYPRYTGQCVSPTTCQQAASSQCKGTVNSRNYLAINTCGSGSPTDELDTKKSCFF
jgi:hypothetical protein